MGTLPVATMTMSVEEMEVEEEMSEEVKMLEEVMGMVGMIQMTRTPKEDPTEGSTTGQ